MSRRKMSMSGLRGPNPKRIKFSAQKHCPIRPPCPAGMSRYKMKKSRSHCCRSSWKHRVGPKNIWPRLMHAYAESRKKGKHLSRKQYSLLYHELKKRGKLKPVHFENAFKRLGLFE